ncbi:MAG: DUF58 domain-containing protein [Chitinispirillaceae bacterium]
MKFILTPKSFLLPGVAGLVLLFQNWIPEAQLMFAVLNLIALGLITADYFTLPGPEKFNMRRTVPQRLFLRKEDTVSVSFVFKTAVPLRLTFFDVPPPSFVPENPEAHSKVSAGPNDVSFSYPVLPEVRGHFSFSNGGARVRSALGLIARQFRLPCETETDVFPCLPSEQEDLRSLFYMSKVESRIMRVYGPGREYSQLRDYVTGDDRRSIHWKRSAAAGSLVVKEFEPEKGQNVFLMVDGGRLMMAELQGLSKVDWALSSSFSLAREALNQRDSVGVMGFSNDIDVMLRPSNRQTQLSSIVKAMYSFQPRFIEPDYANAFRWAYSNLSHRCIIVVYTDFIDPSLSHELGAHIRFINKKHRVICCALGLPGLQQTGFSTSKKLSDAAFRAVVREGLDSRTSVLSELRKAGVDVIDASPETLGGAVLSRYARIRWKR